jgi:hypothetical protein
MPTGLKRVNDIIIACRLVLKQDLIIGFSIVGGKERDVSYAFIVVRKFIVLAQVVNIKISDIMMNQH